MTDLVARLRADKLSDDRQHQREARVVLRALLNEAAETIEKLRDERDEAQVERDEVKRDKVRLMRELRMAQLSVKNGA